MIPKMVVISATFMPDATMVGLMSPACCIWSKAITMPITVPRKPNEGAMAMKSVIQLQPFSRLAASTVPYPAMVRSTSSSFSSLRSSPW